MINVSFPPISWWFGFGGSGIRGWFPIYPLNPQNTHTHTHKKKGGHLAMGCNGSLVMALNSKPSTFAGSALPLVVKLLRQAMMWTQEIPPHNAVKRAQQPSKSTPADSQNISAACLFASLFDFCLLASFIVCLLACLLVCPFLCFCFLPVLPAGPPPPISPKCTQIHSHRAARCGRAGRTSGSPRSARSGP